MKTKRSVFTIAVVAAIALQGCAHSSTEQKVDRKLSDETSIKTHSDLREETDNVLKSTPGLSDDQRVKLAALRDSTRTRLDALYAQSLKLRSVLIKDLITTNYNEDEVELIKSRIKTVEDKRLSLIFDAVEQANLILGHLVLTNRQVIMDGFFEGHGKE